MQRRHDHFRGLSVTAQGWRSKHPERNGAGVAAKAATPVECSRRTRSLSIAMHYVYILRCSDGSYYVGSTHDLEYRLEEHRAGSFGGYTSHRIPVELVWSTDFPTEHDAFLAERQIKGWSRAKKEALIRGDLEGVHEIVRTERMVREARRRPR